MHAVVGDDLSHVFRCKDRSWEKKQEVVLAGQTGRRNSLFGKTKDTGGMDERWTIKEEKTNNKVDLVLELMCSTLLEDIGLRSYETTSMWAHAPPAKTVIRAPPHRWTEEEIWRSMGAYSKLAIRQNGHLTTGSAIIFFSRRMRGLATDFADTSPWYCENGSAVLQRLQEMPPPDTFWSLLKRSVEMVSSGSEKWMVRICGELLWFVRAQPHAICPSVVVVLLIIFPPRAAQMKPEAIEQTPHVLFKVFWLLFQLWISDGQAPVFLEEMANYLESHPATLDKMSHFFIAWTRK